MHVVFAFGAVLMFIFGIVTILRAVDLGRQEEQSPAMYVTLGLMSAAWACYTLYAIWSENWDPSRVSN